MGRGFDNQPTHVEIGEVWIDVSVRESHEITAEVSDHPVETGSNVTDHVRPLPRTISIDGIVTNHPLELPLSHAGSARIDTSAIELQVASNPLPRVPPSSIAIEGEPSAGMLSLIPGVDQGIALLGALRLEVRNKVQLSADQHNVNPNARTSLAANVLHFTEPFDRVGAVNEALQSIVDTSQLVTVVTGLAIYQSVALTSLTVERGSDIGANTLKFSATGKVLRFVESEVVQVPDPVNPRGKPAQSQGKQATSAVDPASLSPAAKASLTHNIKNYPGGIGAFFSDFFGGGE